MSNTIIANALVHNFTIKDKKESRINGGLVGVETYGKWKSALEVAHEVFYKYERAKLSLANGSVESIKSEKDNAVKAFKSIIALVGEVNGATLETSIEAMDSVSKYAIKDVERLAGNALTIKSELDNLRIQLNNVSNGMSEDYVSNLEKQYEAKAEELRLEKKKQGSAVKSTTITSYAAFASGLETRLAKAIEKQDAQSYEEIVAEREAKKAANRAKAKARRDANKAAKTSNKPVETVAA